MRELSVILVHRKWRLFPDVFIQYLPKRRFFSTIAG